MPTTDDIIYVYREGGLDCTLELTTVDPDTGTRSALDCTDAVAYMQVRDAPNAPGDPIIDLSTENAAPNPATPLSGMEWDDEAAGILHIVIHEDITHDEDLFPRVTSNHYQRRLFCDVIVKVDGALLCPPIILNLVFRETATVTA